MFEGKRGAFGKKKGGQVVNSPNPPQNLKFRTKGKLLMQDQIDKTSILPQYDLQIHERKKVYPETSGCLLQSNKRHFSLMNIFKFYRYTKLINFKNMSIGCIRNQEILVIPWKTATLSLHY